MPTLHVITACSRLSVLSSLADNFTECVARYALTYLVRWHVAFQCEVQPDPHGCIKFNEIIDLIPGEDWVWILDDDNVVHPQFFRMLEVLFNHETGPHDRGKRAFVFSQNRADALGPVLEAAPENMKPGRVDTAQVVFRKDFASFLRFPVASKIADGLFYEKLFNIHGPDPFVFLKDAMVSFNGCKR